MYNNASGLAPRITREIDLSHRPASRSILGAAQEPNAIIFVQATPPSELPVFDLPSTRALSRKTIKKFGLSSRIDFQTGDYAARGRPGSLRRRGLSRFFTAWARRPARLSIEKAVSVLEPGGLILVHDFRC